MGVAVSWQDSAACRGWPTSWWFPESSRLAQNNRHAIEICHQCGVRPQCLNEAIERRHGGIWGGITEKERKIAARRLRINERINRATEP